MTITAARVEVLTAEVRVLMVGSRQVTMSVFEQLDSVAPEAIEAFGRVSSRRPHCLDGWGGPVRSPYCPRDCVDVVGCDIGGTLVRSCAERGIPTHRGYCRIWLELPLIVLAGLR
jgi:hypothetical protein